MRIFSLLILTIFLCSCAKSPEEQLESAKNEAKYHLTKGKCSKARSVLDDVGYYSSDALYVSLYASTYACDAGYSELDFISNLSNLNSASIISSLAAFPSSDPANFDHTKFENMMAAIQILLLSAGATPSTTAREEKFGVVRGTDLSIQALYMIMYSMGQFFAYYGNADATGLKGQGTASNVCIGYYTADSTDINNFLTGITGTPINGCNSSSDGHIDIKPPEAVGTIATRMCHGIILFNNMFDILSNVTLSSNSSLGDLSSVSDAISGLYTAAVTSETDVLSQPPINIGDGAAVSTLKDITLQSSCEDQLALHHQVYYLILFETNFTNT